jgi:uncharacterized HAD superfamily protein
MQGRSRIVCVDIDGTLSNDGHRQHLRPQAGSPLTAWDPFHAACVNDIPRHDIAVLIRNLAQLYKIHLVSGRPHSLETPTKQWLAAHDIPYDKLRLYKPEDQPRNNHEHKLHYLQELRQQGAQVVLFIEDQPEVAKAIQRTTDIPVLWAPRPTEW